MEEAIEWVKRCPNPMLSESEIEIRRIFAAEDFGDAFTPELKEQEERMRSEMEGYQLEPPQFKSIGELLIAGLNATYTFEDRANIPSQWQSFISQLGKIPGQIGKTTYGVCWNYKPGCGFDYLTGVEVEGTSGLPKEFTHIRLSPQRHAVFAHRKHVSSIPSTIEAIWTKWLPNSGHQAAGTASLERYGEQFDPLTHSGDIEIWLPLQG